jgi:uncharacterized delta-60 repeat protein
MNQINRIVAFVSFLLCLFSGTQADVVGTRANALSMVLQTNARPVIAGFVDSCNKEQVLIARYLSDGTLDGTLNGTGYNVTLFGGGSQGKAVTMQTDGKIVVAGYSDNTIGLLRFTTAGILDPVFGTNGRVNLNLGLDEQGNAVLMQSGKILVAGNATVAGVTQFFVCRFNATGSLDTGFGTSGITTTLIGDGCGASAMGIQSTGRIVLAGTAVVAGQVVLALSRYTASGVPDATFGIGGTTNLPVGNFAVGSSMAIDSSNRILVAGYTISSGLHQIVVARFTANGTLDGSFGTSGVTVINIPDTEIDYAAGIVIQADGNIVVAGKSGAEVIVARLIGSNGSFDTTFGGGLGYVLTTIGEDAGAAAVVVQPADQMLLVAGYTDDSVFVARYDVDGNLDTTFGNLGSGWVIEPKGSPEALCGNCTVCPTGPQGPTGIASLGSYAYLYNSSLSLALSALNAVPVPFSTQGIVVNLTHSTTVNPDQIIINSSGTYKLTAVIDLNTAPDGANFEFYKNSAPITGTSFGLTGVGVVTVQSIVQASPGDFIQLIQTDLVNSSLAGVASLVVEQIA